ncbi:hypothetical protein QBC47DRAFT_60731 [Echria macrotheca]|uniref:Uncharacterized protein n=1 Tax=Echria macrotheca TaxID=438768 RepID=A0AAJ0F3R5_9PEZI|nr:hypothetical protein QBC47DRAFT_60731 [Echria macrotheca]
MISHKLEESWWCTERDFQGTAGYEGGLARVVGETGTSEQSSERGGCFVRELGWCTVACLLRCGRRHRRPAPRSSGQSVHSQAFSRPFVGIKPGRDSRSVRTVPVEMGVNILRVKAMPTVKRNHNSFDRRVCCCRSVVVFPRGLFDPLFPPVIVPETKQNTGLEVTPTPLMWGFCKSSACRGPGDRAAECKTRGTGAASGS